ncbi:hypothetical protein [Leuconostoc pseudomesenteroides]|uniref:hypothetical protein n=1 Tax=Leuconostoc pseudomesenteroides TaxID=33968 RepID=UPI0039EBAA99
MIKYIRELSIWIISLVVGKMFKLSSADALSLATVVTAVVYLAFVVAKYIDNLESWQDSVNQHIKSQGDDVTPTALTQFNNANNTNSNSNSSNINISVSPSQFSGNETVKPNQESNANSKDSNGNSSIINSVQIERTTDNE